MKSKHYIVLLIWLFISAGCRLIDDDLSVCGTESDYLINYQVRLVTEVHMAIDEKLSLDIEKPIADALKAWSDTIFSGNAHDLDMYFYSLDGTNELTPLHQAFFRLPTFEVARTFLVLRCI